MGDESSDSADRRQHLHACLINTAQFGHINGILISTQMKPQEILEIKFIQSHITKNNHLRCLSRSNMHVVFEANEDGR